MPEKRDETFSRENRLRSSSDFQRIFSRGKRIATTNFVVYFLPGCLAFSRLGIQVKARIGPATSRNYIKRIVREVFRKMKDEFREPLDLIFIAEKGMRELKYELFEIQFRKALQTCLQ